MWKGFLMRQAAGADGISAGLLHDVPQGSLISHVTLIIVKMVHSYSHQLLSC